MMRERNKTRSTITIDKKLLEEWRNVPKKNRPALSKLVNEALLLWLKRYKEQDELADIIIGKGM